MVREVDTFRKATEKRHAAVTGLVPHHEEFFKNKLSKAEWNNTE